MAEHATAADFSLANGADFVRTAVYFPCMDCVDYIRADGVNISERVDQFLTVIRDENGKMVGFRVKVIKNFLLRELQPALSLSSADFVNVRELFIVLASKMGEDLFGDDNNTERKKAAYIGAMKIASTDEVQISLPEYAAAA